MESVRQSKAARLIQKELSNLFLMELKALFSGTMVSVTVVRMSPDLRTAKVYLSFFGSKDKKSEMKIVQEAGADIRRRLGNALKNQLRNVPELHFYLDDSIDYAEEINNILRQNNEEK